MQLIFPIRWILARFWHTSISGSFRDPLVGRDLLVGFMLGVFGLLLLALRSDLALRIGVPPAPPYSGYIFAELDIITGAPAAVSRLLDSVVWATCSGLAMFFPIFLLRVLLRRDWIALALAFVLWMGGSSLYYSLFPDLTLQAFVILAGLFVLFRFGLLALASYFLFTAIFAGFPITLNWSAWYSGMGLAGMIPLLGLTIYAFHTSLGGQPLFGRASLED